MISALAETGAALGREDYLDAAVRCASFVLSDLRDGDGRLLRSWKNGAAHLDAYLEDHAFLLEALISLYEGTGDVRWYREATALADAMIESFSDPERGGFFTTGSGHEQLAARRKDLEDSPIPSGNSAATFGLLRLALLSGEGRYERHALGVLRLLFPLAARHPLAFGHLLAAADFYLARVQEVAIVGPPSEAGSATARGPRRLSPPPRARDRRGGTGGEHRRTAGRRPSARRARARRRPRRGVRVRAVRLPGPGHEPRGPRGGAGSELVERFGEAR